MKFRGIEIRANRIRYSYDCAPPTLEEAKRVLFTAPNRSADLLALRGVRTIARDCLRRGLPKTNEIREIELEPLDN